jgi:hypothetical protein
MIIIDFSYGTILEIPAFESSIRRLQTRIERMTNSFQVSFKKSATQILSHLGIRMSLQHRLYSTP